jgi:signal transduction histidine kinase
MNTDCLLSGETYKKKEEEERLQVFKKSTQFVCFVLSLPLFMLFGVADWFYASDKIIQCLLLRIAILPVGFIVGIFVNKTKSLFKAQLALVFFAFVSGGVISSIIFITEGVTSSYYAGLNLVMIGFTTFLPWYSKFLITGTIAIYGPYYLGIALNWNPLLRDKVIVNSFFIGGTIIISSTFRHFNETLRGKEFRARLEIQEKNLELESALNLVKQTQAELIQSEKLASLGTLAAGLAHELNNCLHFVSITLSPLERLLAEIGENEHRGQILRMFGRIKEGTELASEIIDNLKNYVSSDNTKFESVELEKIVSTVLSILKSNMNERIEVKSNIPTGLCVLGNRAGLNQLLMNLLKNSIDSMKQGGIINIIAREQSETWTMEVEDTGEGIPDELLTKIYDPFFTTKEVGQGTGLGLFVVHKEVKRHHGQISVSSTIGKGTRFTLQFPKSPIERT